MKNNYFSTRSKKILNDIRTRFLMIRMIEKIVMEYINDSSSTIIFRTNKSWKNLKAYFLLVKINIFLIDIFTP